MLPYETDVVYFGMLYPWALSTLSLSWVNRIDGVWTTLYIPTGCRTRLHDYWCNVNKNPKYPHLPTGSLNGVALDQEHTSIFFTVSDRHEERVLENIKKLNRIEKKYGISLTTVQFVEYRNKAPSNNRLGAGVIFTGDKDWQSNLWKISLYSFLLKAVCCSNFLSSSLEDIKEYAKVYRANRNNLLPKVKTEFTEIAGDYKEFNQVHVLSGFVSICTGQNPKMAALLLTGDKK